MGTRLHEVWQQVWQQLNHTAPDVSPIMAAYSQKHRHYHNLQHIDECLKWWQQCQQHILRPNEVALAIVYHDVVYQPWRQDNEAQSARYVKAHLQDALDDEQKQLIATLILDTQHHNASLGSLSHWMLDIDLSILGANNERFEQYQQQIAQEYAFVPRWLFEQQRRRVMQGFAKRQPLFQTEFFQQRLQAQANLNLQAFF